MKLKHLADLSLDDKHYLIDSAFQMISIASYYALTMDTDTLCRLSLGSDLSAISDQSWHGSAD